MSHCNGSGRTLRRAVLLICLLPFPMLSHGKIVVLKNGWQLRGDTAAIASLGDDPFAPPAGGGKVDVELIVVVDDGLRRTFVSRYQIDAIRDDVENLKTIRLTQNVHLGMPRVGRIGQVVEITPFDAWGRRRFSVMSPKGRVDILQGITEITPIFTRVQGLKTTRPYSLDMRLATSSLPRDTLREILATHLDLQNPDVRLDLAQLYLQSERYGDAELELQQALRDFPQLQALQQQLRSLRQLRSRQQLDEIRLRQAAGQHQLVMELLRNFPTEDVAGEILLEVSELADSYQQQTQRGQEALKQLETRVSAVGDAPRREVLLAFLAELHRGLNFNTLPRLADFLRLQADAELTDDAKLALALSGWLLGGPGTDNLALATSLWRVRDIVQEYLVSSDASLRQRLTEELSSLDGGSPSDVARVLGAMTPPRSLVSTAFRPEPDAPAAGPPGGAISVAPVAAAGGHARVGLFEVTIPGVEEGQTLRYLVQLPPEYDPHRRYPAVVTLHAAQTSPEMQIDWWAGQEPPEGGMRLGQAARRGFVVIAPAWAPDRQTSYEYTGQEHAAVLFALRDALQRVSIDSDRVFLSGHSMGGTAAWDIGLSHPDLWAGVIPINAVAEYGHASAPKYVSRYWQNGRLVSFYFVRGALDGSQVDLNTRDLNRYLSTTGFDTVVAEFLGRGEEHFQDEILRIFGWMETHRRNFSPPEIDCRTMRPWDNFFYWLESASLPERSMVLPQAWPPPGGVRPTQVEGSVRDKKDVRVKVGTGTVTIWLSPELVHLDGEVTVSVNGRTVQRGVQPSNEVLLEDARTRGDRQHPFWARVPSE